MLSLPAAFAQGVSLEASLNPSTCQAGARVVYSLTLQNASNPSELSLPNFDATWGFSGLQSAGTSTQAQFGTSGNSQSVTYRYVFDVSKEGTFVIPPARMKVAGAIYQSNPVTLKVAKSDVPAAANLPPELQGLVVPPQVPDNPALSKALNGAVFIMPLAETKNPYNGQQILVTFYYVVDPQLLAQAGFQPNSAQPNQVEIPDMKQFLKDEVFPVPTQGPLNIKERQFGGKTYSLAPLYQVAVTPTKTGKLEIGPFKLGVILSSSRRQQRSSPFDDPFGMLPDMDSFFGGGNRIQIVAMSPQLEFDVKPLPKEGQPRDFSGAVGDFSLTATLDKKSAVAGEDVVKLRLEIGGRGDASQVSSPKLPNVNGLTALDDEPKTATARKSDNDQLVSTKSFDYILRPTAPGKITIPPIALSVFNPAKAQYSLLKSQPLELEVAPGSGKQVALVAPSASGAATPAGGTGDATKDEAKDYNQDLRYIHTGALEAAEAGTLTGQGPLFLLLVGMPPLLVLAGFVAGRRKMAYETNRGYYRQIAAGSVARKHLREAGKLLKGTDGGAFFGELAQAVRGYFGDKFRIEPSALTIEQIESQLASRGASPEDAARVRRLLDECDFARYAPVAPGAEQREKAYQEAASLLEAMEKIR